MALVVAGLLNKQIAGELGTSEASVKVHRQHVMEKMQPVPWPNWSGWLIGSESPGAKYCRSYGGSQGLLPTYTKV